MSKVTTNTEVQIGLLLLWMRWYNRVILLLGLFFLLIFVIRQSPASLMIGGIMIFVYFPLTLYGLHKARQNQSNPALFSIAFVCWTLVLVVAGRGSIALPVTLPLALLPMIISLPYISPRGLLGLAIGTLLVCITATVLTLFGPLLPSSLDERTLAVIMVPMNSLVLGLAVFGLWHVASRLRKDVSTTEAINSDLAMSERLLEQKVQDRTSDLESALAEISEIENIAIAVNVTLDLDDVMAAMRKALQRVFALDGVARCDLHRECLCVADAQGSRGPRTEQ